jgi:hypothetical protein
VGIGTSSPAATLHISGLNSILRIGATSHAGLEYDNGSGSLFLGGDNGQNGTLQVKNTAGAVQTVLGPAEEHLFDRDEYRAHTRFCSTLTATVSGLSRFSFMAIQNE